jgi:hypothetical protein
MKKSKKSSKVKKDLQRKEEVDIVPDNPNPSSTQEPNDHPLVEGDTSEETLVTERPVPSAPEKPTSEYVVTIDNKTGETIKVETLDENGARKELTEEESAARFGQPDSEDFDDGTSGLVDQISVIQAYHKGVVDYLDEYLESLRKGS